MMTLTATGDLDNENTPLTVTQVEDCEGTFIQDGAFVTYRRRWLMLFLFSCNTVVNGMLFLSFVSINNIMADYYHVGPELIDLTTNICFALNVVVTLPSAFLISWRGIRPLLVCGAGINVVTAVLRYIGRGRDGYYFVLVSQMLQGVSYQCTFPVAPRLAALWFGECEQTTATSIGGHVMILGYALAFLVSTNVVRASADVSIVAAGVRTMAFMYLVLCCIVFVLILLFFRGKPPTPPSRLAGDPNKGENLKAFIASLKKLVLNKRYVLMCLGYGLYHMVYYTLFTVLNKMVTTYYPVSYESLVGWMAFSCNVISIPATVALGVLLDHKKWQRSHAVVLNFASGIVMSAFTASLWLAPFFKSDKPDFFWASVIIFMLFGLTGVPYLSTGLQHAVEIAGKVSESTSCACLLLCGHFYGMVAIAALGKLVNGGHVALAGSVMGGSFFISGILVYFASSKVR